jgi:hypothetical protein
MTTKKTDGKKHSPRFQVMKSFLGRMDNEWWTGKEWSFIQVKAFRFNRLSDAVKLAETEIGLLTIHDHSEFNRTAWHRMHGYINGYSSES